MEYHTFIYCSGSTDGGPHKSTEVHVRKITISLVCQKVTGLFLELKLEVQSGFPLNDVKSLLQPVRQKNICKLLFLFE